MQEKRKNIQEYLSKNVNIFIQPLVYDLVKKKPSDPAQHALEWLKNYIDERKPKENTSPVESEDEPNEVVEQKIIPKKKAGEKKTRRGISEEVFGSFNPKENAEVRCIPKDQSVKTLILGLIRNSILFQNLSEKDENIVIDAMEEKIISKGDHIINEGEKGDSLYIVAEGQYDCFKVIGGEDKYLKTYLKGEAFGELALMYNAPRAATIISKGDGKIYALDRITFSQIVKGAAVRKRQLYQKVMSKVDIFAELSNVEREQFYDILREEKYVEGDYVIKQGDKGNQFYIVVEGELVAEKQQGTEEQSKVVYQYKEGDYFGELALLHDIPRQASVKAVSRVIVAKIEREAFMRLLGSLEDILKRNEDRYRNYQEKLNQ